MNQVTIKEIRQRFDEDLSKDIITISIHKELRLTLYFIDKMFQTKIIKADIENDNPYMILMPLVPREGNKLAEKRKEVEVRLDFMYNGLLYHARYKLILWGTKGEKDDLRVMASPPLDIKLASQVYICKPKATDPVFISIPVFKEIKRIKISSFTINKLLIEDRFLSSTLPEVRKLNEVTMQLGPETTIKVPGKFQNVGESKVEFVFNKLPKEQKQILSAALENDYYYELKIKADVSKTEPKPKRAAPNQFKLMIYSNQNDYVLPICKKFEERNAYCQIALNEKEFSAGLEQRTWDLIVVDGLIENLDLWEISRKIKEVFENRESQHPPLVLLLNNLSEDDVVYAQYCDFQHVYRRDQFSDTAVSDVGLITGHIDWVTISERDNVILIIDDDENVTFPLQYALSNIGYRAIVVKNGAQGVRYAKQYKPKVILLEIALRSGDGLEALRMIKKMPFTANIPLLICTVSKDENDLMAARQQHADGYLNKPIETKNLIEKITALLSD